MQSRGQGSSHRNNNDNKRRNDNDNNNNNNNNNNQSVITSYQRQQQQQEHQPQQQQLRRSSSTFSDRQQQQQSQQSSFVVGAGSSSSVVSTSASTSNNSIELLERMRRVLSSDSKSYEGVAGESSESSNGDGLMRNDDDDDDDDDMDRNYTSCTSSYKWPLFFSLIVLIGFVIASFTIKAQDDPVTTHSTSDILEQTGQLGSCDIGNTPGGSSSVESLRNSAVIAGLEHGVVASDQSVCSKMGVTILYEQEGNAVDAAVTTALCLGIVNPSSSGIGGGAFILIHATRNNNNTTTDNDKNPPFNDARQNNDEFSLLQSTSGKVTEVIDCRETAPAAASTNMYEHDSVSGGSKASILGGLAVAVPGELRGLELAHARFGKLPWKTVVQPVIDLLTKGVTVDPYLAHVIQETSAKYQDTNNNNNGYNTSWGGLRNILTRQDNWNYPLQAKELMRNHKLLETLQAVQEQGADAVYTGDRAQALARDIQTAGGIVTAEDLSNYRPTIRTPLVAHDVFGFSVVGVPPPSSGGAAIIGAARFLAGFAEPLASFPDTLSVHRIVEAMKHVFAIRMSLSDPAYNTDTVNAAVYDLTQGTYMEELRKNHYQDDTTLSLGNYGGTKWAQLNDTDATGNATDAHEGDRRRTKTRRILHERDNQSNNNNNNNNNNKNNKNSEQQQVRNRRNTRRKLADPFGYLEDHGTSHFSVVDKDGNAVSMTTSINTIFGSMVLSESTGILLGNTMGDFANPGKHDFFGLKPSEANYIQPGKRPLSSMSPTFVFRQEKTTSTTSTTTTPLLSDLYLAIGASGGPKIITAVLQVLLHYVVLGKPLFDSMAHPRVHDQLVYHGAAATTLEKAVLDYLSLSSNNNNNNNAPVLEVSNRTQEALTRRKHLVANIDYTGCVQAVAQDLETRTFTAACDIRKGGSPAGY